MDDTQTPYRITIQPVVINLVADSMNGHSPPAGKEAEEGGEEGERVAAAPQEEARRSKKAKKSQKPAVAAKEDEAGGSEGGVQVAPGTYGPGDRVPSKREDSKSCHDCMMQHIYVNCAHCESISYCNHCLKRYDWLGLTRADIEQQCPRCRGICICRVRPSPLVASLLMAIRVPCPPLLPFPLLSLSPVAGRRCACGATAPTRILTGRRSSCASTPPTCWAACAGRWCPCWRRRWRRRSWREVRASPPPPPFPNVWVS